MQQHGLHYGARHALSGGDVQHGGIEDKGQVYIFPSLCVLIVGSVDNFLF